MAGYEFVIFDIQGKSVYSSSINMQVTEIDLSSWNSKGLFYLRVYDKSSNQVALGKIIIE